METTYKGFNKGLICKEYKYEVGKENVYKDDVALCSKGFHSCKLPLDILTYYPLTEDNEYGICEVDGIIKGDISDSKIVSSKLKVNKIIDLEELVKDHVKLLTSTVKHNSSTTAEEFSHSITTKNRSYSITAKHSSHAITTGGRSHAITIGEHSHSTTLGFGSHAVTTGKDSNVMTAGENSHAVTTGMYSRAATTGNNSHSVTEKHSSNATAIGNYSYAITMEYSSHSTASGYNSYASTAGNNSHAITTGHTSHTVTTGDRSHSVSVGVNSSSETKSPLGIATAMGKGGKVRGVLGSRLICTWWKDEEIIGVRTAKITKKSHVRPNKWYLINSKGEWEEVVSD